ncbi:hypothetical protein ACTOWA_13610 [Herbaspirillum seropedicae]|uniref:hypothetical protein n=1 Tax=Herbaspirillum seropedicae TaxID=964 RepID=UPI003F8D8E39
MRRKSLLDKAYAEVAQRCRMDNAARSAFSDVEKQRDLTLAATPVDIWDRMPRKHGATGRLAQGRKKTPQAWPAGLILPKEGGGDNGSVS